MDDIPPRGFVGNFLKLVEGEDFSYSFWVELNSKNEIAMWGLLILFSPRLVPHSLQPSLLDKMAERHKETCAFISVAEQPLLCSRGRISVICMALSVLLGGK